MKVHIHSELLLCFHTYLLSKFGNFRISTATYRTKSRQLNSSSIQSDLQIAGCRKSRSIRRYDFRTTFTMRDPGQPWGTIVVSQIPASSRANIPRLLHLIINSPFALKRLLSRKWQVEGRASSREINSWLSRWLT